MISGQPGIRPGEWDTKNVIWDFEIQMDYLTPLRRPDLVKINNKNEKKREPTE